MFQVACLPLLTTPRTIADPIWPVFAPHSCCSLSITPLPIAQTTMRCSSQMVPFPWVL